MSPARTFAVPNDVDDALPNGPESDSLVMSREH